MTDQRAVLAETRLSLHRLAEHILTAAVYRETGHIGLRPAPGGISTPAFGSDATVIAVEGNALVVRSDSGERRARVTTLREAGSVVGITPGGPASVYRLATSCSLDTPLPMDRSAMQELADWYALGDRALASLRDHARADQPSEPVLWPEHLDLAIAASRVNYGFSPGDEFSPEPYVYVGPPAGRPANPFWNAPFGAFRTNHAVTSVDEAVEFLMEGRDRVVAAAGTTVEARS
jgi:hypothetical protein